MNKKKPDKNRVVKDNAKLGHALSEAMGLIKKFKHVNETLFFVLNDQCLKIKFILEEVADKSPESCKFCEPVDGEHDDDCPMKMLAELKKEIDITLSELVDDLRKKMGGGEDVEKEAN